MKKKCMVLFLSAMMVLESLSFVEASADSFSDGHAAAQAEAVSEDFTDASNQDEELVSIGTDKESVVTEEKEILSVYEESSDSVASDLTDGTEEVKTGIYEGFQYEETDDSITIIRYCGDEQECIEVPETINGKKVTHFSAYGGVFAAAKDTVVSIKMPNIESIPGLFFWEYSKLKEVEMPNVKSIGTGAFQATALEAVAAPELVSIGNYAFAECEQLKEIKAPSAEKVEEMAFWNCTSLETVSLPKAAEIGRAAFACCEKLQSIDISQVSGIGSFAFVLCSSLEEISLPGVVRVGADAFLNCTKLTSVTFLNNVEEIGSNAIGYSLDRKISDHLSDQRYKTGTEVTIYGPEGSAAETYAASNDIAFVPIKVSVTPTPTATPTPEPTAAITPTPVEYPAPELNTTSIILQKGQSTTAVKVTNLTEKNPVKSWKSSDKSVVRVNKNGKITAKETGKATITVTMSDSQTAKIKVKVQNGTVRTKKITGLKARVTVKKGKKTALNPSLSPITSQEKITYVSSNKKVATVSSKGVIRGLKPGKAKITVKSGKKKYVITVTVTK